MDVSILIVCWNSERFIYNCLKSIYEHTKSYSFEVIIVDNGSSDKTVEIIEENFPDVKVINAGVNYGFARANNIAIGRASGDFYFLLNPDTYFWSDIIGELVGFMKGHPEAGGATPKIVDETGGIDLSAVRNFPSVTGTIFTQLGLRKMFEGNILFGKEYLPDFDRVSVKEVPYVNGAAILIPRSVMSEVGLLDEKLPMYFEDLDLCAKIRRIGRPLYFVPYAILVHYGAKSSEISPVRLVLLVMEKGQAPWLYFREYRGRLEASIFSLLTFIGSLMRVLLFGLYLPIALVKGKEFKDRTRQNITKSKSLLMWSISKKSRLANRFVNLFSTEL
jgi:GT2 family glycosyltransferase